VKHLAVVAATIVMSMRLASGGGLSPGLISAIDNAGIYNNPYLTGSTYAYPIYVCRNYATDLCDALFPTYACFPDLQFTAGHAQVVIEDPDPNSVFIHYCLVEPQWSGATNANAQCWYQQSGPPSVPPWIAPSTNHFVVPNFCLWLVNCEMYVLSGVLAIGDGLGACPSDLEAK
jgi:hypothetical protein